MTNLKIACADIGYNSARILAQDIITGPSYYTLDSLCNVWDLVAGERYYRTFLASAGLYLQVIYDLGADYAGKQNLADYFIVARGDLAGLTGDAKCTLARSSDGNTWTNIADTTGVAATGPRGHDYIKTFAEVGPYRYYRETWTKTAGTSIYQHSKFYTGKLFTFDFDPDYSYELIPMKDSVWYSSAGAQYFTRADEPLYKFKFTWEHQTDTTSKSFESRIAKYARDCPVFLYTTGEHGILNNVGLVHCRLLDHKISKQWNNLNIIEASFMEVLG